MGLKTFTVPLDVKLGVVHRLIREWRGRARSGGPEDAEIYDALKSIFADLQGRQQSTRSNALGELGRILDRVLRSKTGTNYDENQLQDLARHVINKWPTISQALEVYGEEGAE
jgi:hypothetical protein